MALANGEQGGMYAAAKRPVFGPAVWAPGVAFGMLWWGLGFYFLPWWAALLVWWWPSIAFGAAMGFVALWLARLITYLRRDRAGGSLSDGPGCPP
jgi:hypothetical protein